MTDTNPPTSSVRRSVTVASSAEHAFDVFTSGIDRWWPRQGSGIGSAPLREAVLEPRQGGRWYERDEDGTECTWGRVLEWDPPHRLVLAWQISAESAFDPELMTELEVTFTALSTGHTRVDLEHRNLDRFGARAAAMRAGLENGWEALLNAYAAFMDASGPSGARP